LGQVIENPDEVMRVRFYDPADNNSEPITSEIYLQGALLMTYGRAKDTDKPEMSSWQTGMPSWDVRTELLKRAPELPRSGLVWQDITVEGLDHNELFFVAPFVASKSTSEISFNNAEQRLLRSDQFRDRQFGYRLGTTAIAHGRQMPLTPSEPMDATRRALQLPEGEGTKSLPNLRRLAQRWIDESGLPADDRVGRARYLERQLAASGQFQYSLVAPPRDPNLDPIEDFVTQHPQGHCEYFATALTLMLRSQGIPARMVVGYKCDEWNSIGRYYQVRQLHAHTWVQAYLSPRQIPLDLLHGTDYWPWQEEGGWLRLDPTPAGGGPVDRSSWLTPVHNALDWLDSIWSTYVRELDCERQREAIYGPIERAAQAAFLAVTDPAWWCAIVEKLAALLHVDQLSGAAAWLAIALAGILAAALLAGAGWLFWRLGRRFWRLGMKNHAGRARHGRTQVEFYRRFETILARQGILRSAGQTQREFAETAGLRLARLSGEPQIAPLPGLVADAFYRVRFGGQPLDNPEAQAVEHALVELAAVPRHVPG
jgi:protein-glutamine gamma-glutamyltransferase